MPEDKSGYHGGKGGIIMSTQTSIDVTMELELAEELEQRAASIQLPVGRYIELVLMEGLSSGEEYTLSGK